VTTVEIEAKFAVPDAATLTRLGAAGELAGCALGAPATVEVDDSYLDTPGRSVLGAGYVLRHRDRGDDVVMTLKSTGGADAGVHRREELEIVIARDVAPADWPDGPFRERVLALCDGAPLEPVVELRQSRRFRAVTREGRELAELALDEVTVVTPEGELAPYLEVEVELRGDGTEADLEKLAGALRDEYGLVPQPRSKFERAMELVGLAPRAGVAAAAGAARPTGPTGDAASDAALLDDARRAVLHRVARRKGVYAHRAKALLALDEGHTQIEAGERSGLAERTVRYWLMQFRERGLAIFPARLLAQVEQTMAVHGELPAPSTPKPAAAAVQTPAPGPAPTPAERRATKTAPPAPTAAATPEAAKRAEPAPSPHKQRRHPGIKRTDTMAEAAAKTLDFHFERMLAHEAGTRDGGDPEDLHDMRVATRRMRAALRIFDSHLDRQVTRPLVRGLRATGRTLGDVRDLDVFRLKMQAYLDALPEARRGELDPLIAVLDARRDEARQRMLEYLDGPRYERFVARMREFLETPHAGALPAIVDDEARPQKVADVLPGALYDRLAAVWAYDGPLSQPDAPLVRYHRLRIAGKALRYTLEFFEEALGPGARPMIATTKRLQDHLGDLQDAVVACGVLRTFLTFGTWEPPAGRRARALPPELIVAPGVATYLAVRQEEIARLVRTFPQTWRSIRGADFATGAAALVARLTGGQPPRRTPSA
jgi:CHAD domain-containing protein/DNA-binding transcriptional ArsR family regulator